MSPWASPTMSPVRGNGGGGEMALWNEAAPKVPTPVADGIGGVGASNACSIGTAGSTSAHRGVQ